VACASANLQKRRGGQGMQVHNLVRRRHSQVTKAREVTRVTQGAATLSACLWSEATWHRSPDCVHGATWCNRCGGEGDGCGARTLGHTVRRSPPLSTVMVTVPAGLASPDDDRAESTASSSSKKVVTMLPLTCDHNQGDTRCLCHHPPLPLRRVDITSDTAIQTNEPQPQRRQAPASRRTRL
jgi:hypothetical protein